MGRPRRGEVYDLKLDVVPYADEWGARPGIVVSNDWYNDKLTSITFVTLTGKDRGHQAGIVRVPRAAVRGSPGLSQDSCAVCHSPVSVPEGAIGDLRGEISDSAVMAAIEEAMAFALGIGPDPEDLV